MTGRPQTAQFTSSFNFYQMADIGQYVCGFICCGQQ